MSLALDIRPKTTDPREAQIERLLLRADIDDFNASYAAALDAGTIAGAALDVYQNEPHVPEPLKQSPKTVLTPHMASGTVEGRKHMADMMLANLDAFLAGSPLPTAVA